MEEVLMELAPALNLEFKRVEQEEDADLRAFVGVLRAAADGYVGADEYKRLVTDSAGFASWDNNRRGETTSAYLFVWKLDDGRWGERERDRVKKVTIHEVLHAAVPISHSSRIDSVMGGSSLRWLSPIDEALIRLNSHRLVQPGMTMEEVKALVVFRDELLDVATPPELDAREMLWRTAVQMSEAGSTKFRIRGGYPGHRCDYKFGGRREMATLEVSGLNRFLGSPRLSRFTEHKTDFFLAWSGDLGKWRYWMKRTEAGPRSTTLTWRTRPTGVGGLAGFTGRSTVAQRLSHIAADGPLRWHGDAGGHYGYGVRTFAVGLVKA